MYSLFRESIITISIITSKMKTVGPIISYSRHTKHTPDIHLNLSKDLNIRVIVLKFSLDMFLRYMIYIVTSVNMAK